MSLTLINLIDELKQRVHGNPLPEDKYDFSQLTYWFDSPNTDAPTITQMPPSMLNRIVYSNDTNINQSQTWTDTRTTTARKQIQLNQAVKHGGTLTMRIPLPLGVDSSLGRSMEISVSETNSQEESLTQTWTWQVPLTVLPHTRVEASLILSRLSTSFHFTGYAYIRGIAKNKYRFFANESWLSWNIGQLFVPSPSFPLARTHPLVEVIDTTTIRSRIEGDFTGTNGSEYRIEVKQFDLDTDRLISENFIQ